MAPNVLKRPASASANVLVVWSSVDTVAAEPGGDLVAASAGAPSAAGSSVTTRRKRRCGKVGESIDGAPLDPFFDDSAHTLKAEVLVETATTVPERVPIHGRTESLR